MSQIITLEEMLDAIDTGLPFDLVYCAADRTRNTGGQLKQREKWTKANIEQISEVVLQKNGFRRTADPRHSKWKTRNIYNPATQEIKKIYIKLVTQFNGKRVLL